jgi:hypothetical protein
LFNFWLLKWKKAICFEIFKKNCGLDRQKNLSYHSAICSKDRC